MFFALLASVRLKDVSKMLVKLTQGGSATPTTTYTGVLLLPGLFYSFRVRRGSINDVTKITSSL